MILMWLMIKTWNKLIVSLMTERPSLVYILSHDFELLLEGTCIPQVINISFTKSHCTFHNRHSLLCILKACF